MRKLENAEISAGLRFANPKSAKSFGSPNISTAPGWKYDDESIVRDERSPPIDYEAVFLNIAESADLAWLQERIMEMSRKAAQGDITAGQAVAALAPIVARRLYPEKFQLPEP